MGANSKIEWTDHTFNPWVGCTKVSAACDHCYAEAWARRGGTPELWTAARRRTTPGNWHQPIKWNVEALRDGVRRRVFCASLADVFDNQVPMQWRRDLFDLIAHTPRLDWLLLTKRPQNIEKMVKEVYSGFMPWPWPNVWLGTTVENQEEADRRIPHLLSVPAKVHFLSCEPLLGPIDLLNNGWLPCPIRKGGPKATVLGCEHDLTGFPHRCIDWVICGGESGGQARPMHPDWARSLRDQCAAAGVAFHFKQWGEHYPERFVRRGKDGEIWREGPDGSQHWYLGESLTAADNEIAPFRIARVGKKAAGRLLDGVEHNGFPG